MGAAAQITARLTGEVRDSEGKPYPDVVVVIKSDEFGTTYEVKTDAKGQFVQGGLRGGVYTVGFKVKNKQGVLQQVYEIKTRVSSADDKPVLVNFKDVIATQGAEFAAAKKKQEEEQAKFEDMKTHFDAGRAALEQSRVLREEIQRAPADQRAALQDQLTQANQAAITEYEAAQKAAPENDPNTHKVLANLGQAYENAGRYEEAAASYEKAIALKPTEAPYFLAHGTTLARLGKVTEAGLACDKAIAIDKVNAATCWRNVGIVLYNTNQLKEAIGPLRKATELDPGYADTWYLLAASLLSAMDFKKEGDKLIPVVQPGTAEAYQKYLELAPNGRFAADAQAGLSTLQAMGAGIETKVRSRKAKK